MPKFRPVRSSRATGFHLTTRMAFGTDVNRSPVAGSTATPEGPFRLPGRAPRVVWFCPATPATVLTAPEGVIFRRVPFYISLT